MIRHSLIDELRSRRARTGIPRGLRFHVLLMFAVVVLVSCAPGSDEALRRYRGEPVERTLGESATFYGHSRSMGWSESFVVGELIALDRGMFILLQHGDSNRWFDSPRLLEIPLAEVGRVDVRFRRYDRQADRDLWGPNTLLPTLMRVFRDFPEENQAQLRQYSRHPLGLTSQLRQRLLERYKQDDFIRYPPRAAPAGPEGKTE